MKTPFPGMDPYLESPALWPDVHNSLVAAIRDVLSPLVAPRYYVALEQRTYFLSPDDLDLVFFGRPDLSVVRESVPRDAAKRPVERGAAVLDVEVPVVDEVRETFLEVREAEGHQVVTVVEILSPANKVRGTGRQDYEEKRNAAFKTRTNFVEIDLLRAWEPMPLIGAPRQGDYRILVSRGDRRPRAQLHVFTVRDPVPDFALPLLAGDDEPLVSLGEILHGVYERARFDLRIDYSQPPLPPLEDEDVVWARELLAQKGRS